MSFDLLGENDTSKIYLVDSQSLGQKHCLSRTKVCKSEVDNLNILYIFCYTGCPTWIGVIS